MSLQIIRMKENTFRQLLLVDLSIPHDKSLYSLKRNQLIIRANHQTAHFNSISYTPEDLLNKIVLEVCLASRDAGKEAAVTVTFNYDIHEEDLSSMVRKLIEAKLFRNGRFTVGHFEIRKSHISDHNKPRQGGSVEDELQEFDREIDNCLKLQRLWKINEHISFKPLTVENVERETARSGRKFGKSTNQFFVIDWPGRLRLCLLILPRKRDFVFKKEEQKEVEQCYIMNKHSTTSQKQSIGFRTAIAQIINTYLQQANLNLFVSALPQMDKPLAESLKVPLRLSNPQQEEVNRIWESYNKDKMTHLEEEVVKMKRRLAEVQNHVKNEQENMAKLTQLFSKAFNKSMSSIDFLQNRKIGNVHNHIATLKREVGQRQEQVQVQQQQLSQLHEQMILDQQRHTFYLNKIENYRLNMTDSFTTNRKGQKTVRSHESKKENCEPTEEELMYFYDPKKQLNKYRDQKEEQMKNRLFSSQPRRRFLGLLQEARAKLSPAVLHTFEQEYYDLINS